jgi:hypothetical protein
MSLPQTAADYTAIAVFVIRLSEMVHLAPCRDDTTAEQFADLFVQHVFCAHGLPRQLVSDRDPRFTGTFWRAQTDGNTERVIRVVEDMLRHYVDPSQGNWDTMLPLVEFAINDSVHESVQSTPFVLNYGKRPRLPVDLVLQREESTAVELQSTNDAADNITARIQSVVSDAKMCLVAAQLRQKAYTDDFRRDVEFDIGTEVMLSTSISR